MSQSKRRSFADIVGEVTESNIRSLIDKAALANRIAKLPALKSKDRAAAYGQKGRTLWKLYWMIDDVRLDFDPGYLDRPVINFTSRRYGFRIHIYPEQLVPPPLPLRG